MKKTKYLVFCALMSALSVVILFIGGLTEVFDLSCVLIASLILFVVAYELGVASLSVYFITFFISLALLPSKLIAFEYLFLGVYPIIKKYADLLKKVPSVLIKAVYMVASTLAVFLLAKFVFTQGAVEAWYIELIVIVAGIATFVFYDFALKRFSVWYQFGIREKLRIDKFFK